MTLSLRCLDETRDELIDRAYQALDAERVGALGPYDALDAKQEMHVTCEPYVGLDDAGCLELAQTLAALPAQAPNTEELSEELARHLPHRDALSVALHEYAEPLDASLRHALELRDPWGWFDPNGADKGVHEEEDMFEVENVKELVGELEATRDEVHLVCELTPAEFTGSLAVDTQVAIIDAFTRSVPYWATPVERIGQEPTHINLRVGEERHVVPLMANASGSDVLPGLSARLEHILAASIGPVPCEAWELIVGAVAMRAGPRAGVVVGPRGALETLREWEVLAPFGTRRESAPRPLSELLDVLVDQSLLELASGTSRELFCLDLERFLGAWGGESVEIEAFLLSHPAVVEMFGSPALMRAIVQAW